MLENFDIMAGWQMFVDFMDRIVAWLFCVIGGGEWDPDYGK